MKRFLVSLVLLVIIIITFGIVILWTLANSSGNNFFNVKYRVALAKQEWLRPVLKLTTDGDARSDYLGSHYRKITIEVDEMDGLHVPTKAMDLLAKKISAVTGKETGYVISDENIPYQDSVTQADLVQIAQRYRNYTNGAGFATLYVLLVTKDATEPDLLGVAYSNFGIVLFGDPIQNATRSNPDTFANYIESTALHEFGHQLGLPHNDQEGCIMQAVVEQNDIFREQAKDVITDFCPYEKGLIKKNSG